MLVAFSFVLVACAAGPNDAVAVGAPHLAGFWLGLWHGVISPIAFVVSLFNAHVGIYDVHNSGNWYNFGFMIGLSASLGGAARSGRCAGPKRVAK